MKTVTQKARFRQAVINYAEKYGVTRGANSYDVTRQYIYRWKKRYDGNLYSLEDKSHRPHSHPKSAHRTRIKANLRCAKEKSLHWFGGVVSKTSTKRVYSVGGGTLPHSDKN